MELGEAAVQRKCTSISHNCLWRIERFGIHAVVTLEHTDVFSTVEDLMEMNLLYIHVFLMTKMSEACIPPAVYSLGSHAGRK